VSEVDRSAILSQLERVVSSAVFRSSGRLRGFLQFVVNESLAGNADSLKEFRVGVEVYGKDAEKYDPATDPIVRVEAARLRSKLREYYEGVGAPDPVRIEVPKGSYAPRFSAGNGAGMATASPGLRDTRRPFLAVLPFASPSHSTDNDLFADGLTDELISSLARLPGLRVLARTSSFCFRQPMGDVRKIGAELGVQFVVEGSVRRSAGQLRVTAQLADCADGCLLWSGAFDRASTDLLEMQTELANAIAGALRLELARPDGSGSGQPPGYDSRAHEMYLQGLALFNRWTVDGARQSLPFFEKANALAPRYAPAHYGMAQVWGFLAFNGFDTQRNSALARTAVDRAVALDPGYGEAYTTLGILNAAFGWNWLEAERAFHVALSLCPGSSRAHYFYASFYLFTTGRGDEALAEMLTAAALDPLSPNAQIGVVRAWYLLREYDRALEAADRTLAVDRDFREGHWLRGMIYTQTGNRELSLRSFERAEQLEPARTGASGRLGYALARFGRQEEARRLLEMSRQPAERALILLGLDEIDLAFEAMEEAARTRDKLFLLLKLDPQLDGLRRDKRYQALLRRASLDNSKLLPQTAANA
jgi:TolB-like protein/Tfp pilus assembly protein PilF